MLCKNYNLYLNRNLKKCNVKRVWYSTNVEKEEKGEDTEGGLGPEPNYQRVMSGYNLYHHNNKVLIN